MKDKLGISSLLLNFVNLDAFCEFTCISMGFASICFSGCIRGVCCIAEGSISGPTYAIAFLIGINER